MALTIASPRWYSGKHIRCICRALGVPASTQSSLRRHLDTAAKFYRIGEGGSELVPPDHVLDQLQSLRSVVRTIQIVSLGSNARADQNKLKRARAKLLRVLNGKRANLDDLLDNGVKSVIRNALCFGNDTYEQEAELMKLVCVLHGSSDPGAIRGAAGRLDRRAFEGIAAIQRVRSLTVPPGHSGDRRFHSWLDSMLAAYIELTGRPIATSVDPVDRTPTGPLIRFLKLAGLALGIRKSDQAWREAIRRSPAYQAHRPAQKKF